MTIWERAGTLAVTTVVVCACREPGVLPPPPVEPLYTTFTLDRPVGFIDVTPSWTGVTILPEGRQSFNIVSTDYGEERLRYAGCANVCDDSTHWLTTTINPAGEGLLPNPGAALTPSGLHVVWMDGIQIRHGYCPGACQFSTHWQIGNLFHGYVGGLGIESTPLVADSSGRLRLVYFTSFTPRGLRYAECSGVCADSAAWSSVEIDSVLPFPGYAVVTSPAGANHVVYPTPRLRYATCATACTDAANWAAIDVVSDTVSGVAVALTATGRLHVVYLVADTAHYATCAGNCTTLGSWQSVSLGKPSPAVAIASHDSVVYVATNEDHVTVSRCSTSCLNPASWESVSVDSAPGGGSLAVSFDSVGHAVVASTYIHLQLTHFKQ